MKVDPASEEFKVLASLDGARDFHVSEESSAVLKKMAAQRKIDDLFDKMFVREPYETGVFPDYEELSPEMMLEGIRWLNKHFIRALREVEYLKR